MNYLRSLIACVLFISSSVFAAPIFQIENSELLGIKDIEVNGTLYNVHFQQGSCNELFNNCMDSAFGSLNADLDRTHSGVMTSASAANTALVALFNSVYSVNIYDPSQEELDEILGFRFRGATTPFRRLGGFINSQMDTSLGLIFANDHFSWSQYVSPNDAVQNYAIWEVPEPSGLALLSIALGGLLLSRRKFVR